MEQRSYPRVSVVMAAYNNQDYLNIAIDSILAQTFHDFEFIIIDDASTDQTPDILNRYAYQDERIRLFRNQEHQGIAGTRNRGNSLARGEFIAVMDHDDLSLPERFAIQVDYLDRHPEIAAVGSNYIEIDSYGDPRGFQSMYAQQPGVIRWRLFFAIQFLHPTMLMRRSILIEDRLEYDPQYIVCPDYDLLFRIANKHAISNLPDVLYQYRRHAANTFSTRQDVTAHEDACIIAQHAGAVVGKPLPETLGRAMKHSTKVESLALAIQMSDVIFRLYQASRSWEIQPEEATFIRRSAAWKLRAIWHSQRHHPRLLPYVLASIILFPDSIKRDKRKVTEGVA